jgi:hypothetical protein
MVVVRTAVCPVLVARSVLEPTWRSFQRSAILSRLPDPNRLSSSCHVGQTPTTFHSILRRFSDES